MPGGVARWYANYGDEAGRLALEGDSLWLNRPILPPYLEPIWAALSDLSADMNQGGIPYLSLRQWIVDRGLPFDWTLVRIKTAYLHYRNWSEKVAKLRNPDG